MMQIRVGAVSLFLLIVAVAAYAVEQVISLPGSYTLGDTLAYDGSTADTAIVQIASSDVILDLNGRLITQQGVGATRGILINPGLSNISIYNGTISATGLAGLEVSPGCRQISLHDLAFLDCQASAVVFNGTSQQPITDSTISSCKAVRCNVASGETQVMSFTFCQRINIQDCIIQDSSNTNADRLDLLRFEECHTCNIHKVDIVNNSLIRNQSTPSFSLLGLSLVRTSSCIVDKVHVLANTFSSPTPLSFLVGISLDQSSSSIIKECCIQANSAPSNILAGLLLRRNSSANTLQNIKCVNSFAAVFFGIAAPVLIVETPEISFFNLYKDCLVYSNTSLLDSVGMDITLSFSSTVVDCISANNVAAATSNGIVGPVLNADYVVVNCLASQHTANTQADGISTTPFSGLFIKNQAYRNSTGQLTGIAPASQVNEVTTLINTVTSPWTNLGVAS